MGWGVSVTPWPLSTPKKDPVSILQEAGWAPGPVWRGEENLVPTGIRSPDPPARSQSIYRLPYPGPLGCKGVYRQIWKRIETSCPNDVVWCLHSSLRLPLTCWRFQKLSISLPRKLQLDHFNYCIICTWALAGSCKRNLIFTDTKHTNFCSVLKV